MAENDITPNALPEIGPEGPMGRVRSVLPRVRAFLLFALGLFLVFLPGAVTLLKHTLSSNLHSHIVLVPLIATYLLMINRRRLSHVYRSDWRGAGIFAVLGIAALVGYFVWGRFVLSLTDSLGLGVAAFLSLLIAGAFAILGEKWVKSAAFPLFFLWFMVPLPDAVAAGMERFLVTGSALVSDTFFRWAGIPVFRNGEVLQIPGIILEVARECSGIRSTWVLFITSLVASYLFLRSPWYRSFLVAAVLPLGILRNALRILVLGWLCVHKGPQMIDSRIHHEGGPLFFAISLIPLFVLAWGFRFLESRHSRKKGSDFL